MTAAGRIVELKRYEVSAGQRALQAQRIDGRVALMDVPVEPRRSLYLVERHLESPAGLQGLADEYAQRSEACGTPAIQATLQTADELVATIA